MNSDPDIKRFYRKNGTLEREVPLVDGKPHGTEVYYREDDSTEAKISWVKGQQHGVEEFFSVDGVTPRLVIRWTYGRMVR